jgi:hypothetical protein
VRQAPWQQQYLDGLGLRVAVGAFPLVLAEEHPKQNTPSENGESGTVHNKDHASARLYLSPGTNFHKCTVRSTLPRFGVAEAVLRFPDVTEPSCHCESETKRFRSGEMLAPVKGVLIHSCTKNFVFPLSSFSLFPAFAGEGFPESLIPFLGSLRRRGFSKRRFLAAAAEPSIPRARIQRAQ